MLIKAVSLPCPSSLFLQQSGDVMQTHCRCWLKTAYQAVTDVAGAQAPLLLPVQLQAAASCERGQLGAATSKTMVAGFVRAHGQIAQHMCSSVGWDEGCAHSKAVF